MLRGMAHHLKLTHFKSNCSFWSFLLNFLDYSRRRVTETMANETTVLNEAHAQQKLMKRTYILKYNYISSASYDPYVKYREDTIHVKCPCWPETRHMYKSSFQLHKTLLEFHVLNASHLDHPFHPVTTRGRPDLGPLDCLLHLFTFFSFSTGHITVEVPP